MFDDNFAEIQKVSHRISGVKETGARFKEFVREYKQNFADVGGVTFDKDDQILIEILGYNLRAEERVVARSDGSFVLEFVLMEVGDEDKRLVCCFYLSPNGEVHKCIDLQGKICDFNNTYICRNLLGFVGEKILASHLFKPTIL